MPGPKQITAAAAAAIAAMSLVATPIYKSLEGEELLPYKDIVGVWTVCSGDTSNVVKGVKLTKAECDARTKKIMEEYGAKVLEYNPSIGDYPLIFASHTIFAANIGVGKPGGKGGYYNSSVLRLSLKGEHRQSCRAMRLYDKAGGRVITGLQNRREGTQNMIGEYELCLAQAVERDLKLI